MALIYCYGDSKLADSFAKESAETLVAAYPNHSWWVECKGGVLVIKNFAISGTVGMLRHMSKLDVSATIRKRDILRAAGELLERAALRRGAYDGEITQDLDADPRTRREWAKRKPLPMKVIH